MKTGKIKFKHSLKTLNKEVDLTNKIVEVVKASFDEEAIKHLKDNNQLILDLCCFIEANISKKNKNKINKKDVVIKAMTLLFDLKDLELLKVAETIEFFHENKLIKRSNHIFSVVSALFHFLVKK